MTRALVGMRVVAVVLILAAVVTLGVTLFAGTDPGGPVPNQCRGGDLVAFWGAAQLLDDGGGEDIYRFHETASYHREICPLRKMGMRVSYPPPVYTGFRAMLPLGYPLGARLLMVALFAVLVGSAVVLPSLGRGANREERLVLAAAVVGSPAAFILTVTVQLGAVWLAIAAGGFILLRRRHDLAGGVVLGLLCAKPTLAAAAFAALALTGRRRAALGWFLGGALLLMASLAAEGLVPWEAYVEFIKSPNATRDTWLGPWRHLTLRSGLAVHLKPRSDTAMAMGNLGMVLGVGLGVWVGVAARRARRHRDELDDLFGLAAVFSAFLLAMPHLLDYDGVVFAPAWLASAWWLRSGRAAWPRAGWILLALGWLAPAFTGIAWIYRVPVVVAPLLAWVVWMGAEITIRGSRETR